MMLQRQRCDLAYPSYFCVFTFATLRLLDRSMMRPSQFVRIHFLVIPNAVIRYAQRHCGSHSSLSQFPPHSCSKRRSQH